MDRRLEGAPSSQTVYMVRTEQRLVFASVLLLLYCRSDEVARDVVLYSDGSSTALRGWLRATWQLRVAPEFGAAEVQERPAPPSLPQ